MSWHGIHGHDDVVEQFRRAMARARLASSFLFTGPAGIGKFSFAVKLAQAMLCPSRPEAALDPCEHCPSCVQVAAGTHPDLDIIARPKDKSLIPLELLIGDQEHRGRVGLCHRLGLKPYMGGRKIAVIDDADDLNPEGANCLLKTLEEPPPRSVLMLIGTSPARQLPTIRSRCQLVRFRPLCAESVAEVLLSRGLVAEASEARRLAQYAEGSLQRALELADPALWAFRRQLLERLSQPVLDSIEFSKTLLGFVEAAGTQAALRRERLRQIVGLAAEFYRHLLRAQRGGPTSDDAELRAYVSEAVRRRPGNGLLAAECLDRCLEADEQIDRNANQSTLVEAWLDGLAAVA